MTLFEGKKDPSMSLDMAAAYPKTDDWYALRVRTRHEKAVAGALRNKGYDEFLPLYKARRQWSQRIAEVELPLFPGYVFCRFEPAQPGTRIVTTPGVMGIVGFGGKPTPVDHHEIAAIQLVLDSGMATEPWKFTAAGQRVRVIHGALAGLEGIFVAAKKNHRLLLSLSLLQRSVAIQIEEASVVALTPDHGMPSPAAIFAAG
jgi:transcription antitermination factor NusG